MPRVSGSGWCPCRAGSCSRGRRPAYREEVLPAGIPRVAVEAGATLGWERYVGSGPVVGVDRFGASAPGAEVAARLGLTEDAVAAAVRSAVSS